MRVLIVSTYFAPELAGNAPYVAAAAAHLASNGHDVTVLTGFPHYPDWKARQRRWPFLRSQWNGARLIRRAHFIPRSPSALARAVYEASLLIGGVLGLRLVRWRPDVVLGMSPALADGVTAIIAARRFDCASAVIFQDRMGVGATEAGVRGGARVGALVSAVELAVARRADAVGYASVGFAEWLSTAGVRSVQRIFNWSQLMTPTRSREATRAAYGWGSNTVCVHGGNIGEKQGLEVVIEAAKLSPKTLFVLAGDGNQKRNLEGRARSGNLDNVQFIGQLSGPEYANVLTAADVLLLTQRPSVRHMSLPSKLATYRATGIPIAASISAESEAAADVRSDPNARLVTPGDPAALALAVTDLATSERRGPSEAMSRDSALGGYVTLLDLAIRSRREIVGGTGAWRRRNPSATGAGAHRPEQVSDGGQVGGA